MGISGALTTAVTKIKAQLFAPENSAEGAAEELVVDDEWYFETYPDVRASAEGGHFRSAQDHYHKHGFLEGRFPSKPQTDNGHPLSAPEGNTLELNSRQIEREIADGICEVSSFPFDIQFSPEHRCNLRCVMCWSTIARNQGITPLMDRRLPNNTLQRFKSLEPYLPFFQSVSLTGSGEPLLSPVFPNLLNILSSHPSTSICFTTHAQVFDRTKAELLVRSGVHEITISMDSACKQTYENIRVHAKWEKLLRTIKLLNEIKAEHQSSRPYICFAINCMRQNIEELPSLIDFAYEHGGHKVLATNTIIYDHAMSHETLTHYPELTRRMVTEAIRRAKRNGIKFDNRVLRPPERVQALEIEALALEGKDESGRTVDRNETTRYAQTATVEIRSVAATPCISAIGLGEIACGIGGANECTRPQLLANSKAAIPPVRTGERFDILEACQSPWKALMVESDGNVKPCSYNSPYIGNLNNQTLEEIWNGKPIVELRRSFIEGRPPENCRRCPCIFTRGPQLKDVFLQLMPTRHFNIEYPAKDCILEGIVDVRGWAIDQDKVSKIEIVINEKVIGEATLGWERPDLGQIFPKFETATAGFCFTLDTRMLADGNQVLALQITNGMGERVEVGHRDVKVQNVPRTHG